MEVSDSASYSLGSGFWGATVKLFTVSTESVTYGLAEGVWIAWQSVAAASAHAVFVDCHGRLLPHLEEAIDTLFVGRDNVQ